jgi:hypothetical protein
MKRPTVRKRSRAVIAATALIFWNAGTPEAAAAFDELCVVCSGPQAVYRCTIADRERMPGGSKRVEKAAAYLCVTELARSGGHQRCSIRTDINFGFCEGIERRISVEQALAPAPAASPTGPPAGAAPAQPVDAAKQASTEPPRTLEEMARRTAAASGDQLKKAGDAAQSTGNALQSAGKAVSDAMGKSWQCVTSLFQRC